MKKLILLFVCSVTFTFISCSDDDPETHTEPNLLLGTWQGQDLEVTGTLSTEIAGIPLSTDFIGDVYEMTSTLTFSENPNNVTSQGTYSAEVRTTIQGQLFVENVEDLSFLDSGTWTISGNELRILTSTETLIATVEELTQDSLVLSTTSEEEVDIDGTTYGATVNAVMVFAR